MSDLRKGKLSKGIIETRVKDKVIEEMDNNWTERKLRLNKGRENWVNE